MIEKSSAATVCTDTFLRVASVSMMVVGGSRWIGNMFNHIWTIFVTLSCRRDTWIKRSSRLLGREHGADISDARKT